MTITLSKWTLDTYHRMINAVILDDRHVELLPRGIVEMLPEEPDYVAMSREADDSLRRVVGDRANVRDSKPISLPNASEPEPDIAIVESRSYRVHPII